MKVVTNILELIGNTPLKRLDQIASGSGAEIWAKLENLNPSGSLKDRMALEMIEDGERRGALKKGDTIIDASTGNTAIALSFVGKMKGYKVAIFMPQTMAGEKVEIVKRYGAEIRLVDVGGSGKGTAIHGSHIEVPGRLMCKAMEANTPKVWWARQFSNPANYRAHMKLGREIIAQMGDRIDAFVASIGTGGTVFGVAQALKEKNPKVRIIAVEPAESPLVTLTNFKEIEGVTGGILREILESKLVDQVVKITDQEALGMYRRLIQEEGLFVGVSAGANVLAALHAARELGEGSRVVTVLPDQGNRYITSEHYVT